MASKYAANGVIAVAGDTALAVFGGTAVNPRIYYVSLSSQSAPADAQVVAQLIGTDGTGAGTGTSVTPLPLSPGDRAAVATAKKTMTAEATTDLAIPYLSPNIHQRSHYQWYAREGGEILTGLAANKAVNGRVVSFSTGTPTMEFVMHWEE
jgi:hypothetical protein